MMKNRISDGLDVPRFFRDLVAMITDVTEDEWDTPKDPSSKLTKENTLRTYAKRDISKKFAQSIVYKLSPEMFIESLESRPKAVLALLADDYKSYDPTATAGNIAEKLADCFVEIIRRAAGLVQKTELERQKLMQQAFELKNKYGDYLRDEADNICAFPGCGRLLSAADSGRVAYTYEVALIDKNKEPKVDNLLALRPMCHATYSIDDSKKLCKELQGVKKILIAVLFTTALPALAHDSLLFKNLGKDVEDGIFRIYNSTKKQIFIAYDKQGDCRPETQKILEDNCVLRLSTNNCELYGRSWDTEE